MVKSKEVFGVSRGVWLQCILLYAGIWAGLLTSPYVFLAMAGCIVLTSLVSDIAAVYGQLFFLLPFSAIFKLSPTSTSLFTYLIIAVGAILLLRQRKVHAAPFMLIMMFAIYALAGAGSEYRIAFRMAVGILLLYLFVTHTPQDSFKNHILSFSLGMLGSSAIGTIKDSWSRLAEYYRDIDYIFVNGENSLRFSGLNYDPNCYSVAAIFVVFLCIRLLLNRDANRPLLAALIGVTAVFGFVSYSKMFVISMIVLAVFCLLYSTNSPKKLLTAMLIAVIVMLLFYYWAGSSGYLTTISRRFSEGDFSSGRFEIWKAYLQYIGSSPRTLLLGGGLDALYLDGRGAHSSYIETLFRFGIIGGGLFVFTIVYLMSRVRCTCRRGVLDWTLVLLFCIMIASLDMITLNDFPFYCMLLWVSMNMCKQDTSKAA